MNIEEYAAQFPVIEREDVKKGQIVFIKNGPIFIQREVPFDEAYSEYSELRLVEDVKPQIEDGFYLDECRRVVRLMTNPGAVQKLVDREVGFSLEHFEDFYLSSLKRLYTVEELIEIDDKLGFCFTAKGFLEKVKEGKF